ncbi:MAG TPA: hypothetical protein VF331_23765 [Polyangiales bacterium]
MGQLSHMVRHALLGCAALVVVTSCPIASAQQSSGGDADALFMAGKAKLAEKDYAQACPLLAQSFQVEPATGTLLALAICHERAGKLASAFAAYNDVVVRSEQEERPDRAKAAADRVAVLEPQLSHLRIELGAAGATDGLAVRVDGELVSANRLDRALPVDGGEHTVELSAPGMQSWRSTIALADSHDDKTLAAQALAPMRESPVASTLAAPARTTSEASPAAVAVAAETAPQTTRAPLANPSRPLADARGLSGVQTAGLLVLGTGLAGLVTASVFTLSAVRYDDASAAGCNADVCTAAARAQRLQARQAGDIATVTFALGSVATAAGLLMCLLGGRTPSVAATAEQRVHGVALAPWIGGRSLGAVAQGAF